MLEHYPATYRDQHGEEITTLSNDGETLRMTIRGVEFVGGDFDDFAPARDYDHAQLASFTFRHGSLSGCILECEMPIPIVIGTDVVQGILYVRLDFWDLNHTKSAVGLRVAYGKNSFQSSGEHGYFDSALFDLQRLLPQEVYLKACTNCAFSEYHPVGRGMFSGLACFRNTKQEFRSIKNKSDLMQIWEKRTEWVQDTYVCREFEPRRTG